MVQNVVFRDQRQGPPARARRYVRLYYRQHIVLNFTTGASELESIQEPLGNQQYEANNSACPTISHRCSCHLTSFKSDFSTSAYYVVPPQQRKGNSSTKETTETAICLPLPAERSMSARHDDPAVVVHPFSFRGSMFRMMLVSAEDPPLRSQLNAVA